MSTLHPLDQVLQNCVPVAIVPKHGKFEPLDKDGHRYLVASDGLWLELRTPWLHLRYPVAQQDAVPMPYGSLHPLVDFKVETPSMEFLGRFIQQGISELPNETGAWITVKDGQLRFHRLTSIHADQDRLAYECPVLEEGETLFIDLHTHGKAPAFFSRTDDEDDRNSVKVAICVGYPKAGEPPQVVARLCALGLFLELSDLAWMVGNESNEN